MEFLFRHLLGRTPNNSEEVELYHKLLQNGNLAQAVDALINSTEYSQFFGEEVVPYQRNTSLKASH